MKVLWFTNTPCNASYYYNDIIKDTGTWLATLDKEIQTKVELTIVFFGSKYHKFKYYDSNYISIKKYNTMFDIIKKILNIENINYTQNFLKIINEIHPDIIHIHGTEGGFLSLLDKVNIPIVISIQGIVTVYHHKYYSGLNKEYVNKKNRNIGSYKSLVLSDNFFRSYKILRKKRLLEEKYLKHAKYIIGRTKWDKRVTKILAPVSRYFHCDEIMRNEFYNNQWRKNETNIPLKLFTTSSNVYYKGIETIIECSNLLNNYGKDHKWYIAGVNIHDSIIKVIKEYNKSLSFSSVVFLGKCTGVQLISELLDSDMYIMPSHIENSPNSLCEAMLLGVPCIATYSGGTGSLVVDGISGVLIQDGDPWSMAGAIIETTLNYSKSVSMGLKAREIALQRHNRKKIVDDLINIYDLIINEKRNGL